MVFAARLTQQGHKIASMDDLMELYEKSFSVQTVAAMGALPHPTIQKFAVITVAIVGASRRFLAQITRHQKAKCSVLIVAEAFTGNVPSAGKAPILIGSTALQTAG